MFFDKALIALFRKVLREQLQERLAKRIRVLAWSLIKGSGVSVVG
jgi:hypothetical protein